MIIRTLLLNSLALFFGLSLFTAVQAADCPERVFPVMRFDLDGEYREMPTDLPGLDCAATSFQSEDFKIVLSVSDDPISFNTDKKTLLTAATVYYHLHLARKFWIQEMNSEFVKNIPQFVMRIEMGRIPSRTRHFKKKDVVTNDALTIMPGQNPPNRGNKKWGYEIWFRPKELVDVTEELEYLGTNPVAQSLGYIEGPISDMAENNMIYEGIDKLVRPEYNTHQTFEQILTINLGTIITIKGISWASQYLDYVFVQDEYYMNTALTADVIYHEFAHIALSKYLEPKHSRPVIEGMADYFVAVQTGRTDLYEPQEDILRIRPKNALNEDLYAPYRETEPYARRDFVLSFLWKVRSNLIEVNNERAERGLKPVIDPDELVFETRKRLTESSVIYPDLTRALIDSYDKVCTVKRIKKDKDNKVIRRICDGGRLGLNAINKAIKQKGFF